MWASAASLRRNGNYGSTPIRAVPSPPRATRAHGRAPACTHAHPQAGERSRLSCLIQRTIPLKWGGQKEARRGDCRAANGQAVVLGAGSTGVGRHRPDPAQRPRVLDRCGWCRHRLRARGTHRPLSRSRAPSDRRPRPRAPRAERKRWRLPRGASDHLRPPLRQALNAPLRSAFRPRSFFARFSSSFIPCHGVAKATSPMCSSVQPRASWCEAASIFTAS